MLEILAIGRAIGFDEEALSSNVVDIAIGSTAKLYESPEMTHKPSMLLDIELGHPLEVEVIVGELVRKAQELHVDVPVCQACVFFRWSEKLTCQ
jgi:2-dehydropantoate 2-reductase